ncbi:quinol dehydrogenase ferredoxin subunit NapH [candidate division LCP-89 bacterium B3_LCP]|uniref:Quinol dehydrogenase ferredoxin subunit NapH n=1 Tax=candidate division LCP-89 bacterium B3_LCP TaxID=2012998 RepID=A0A532UU82_UNCL8|nr:MAG: quinol dehydrogenase ferredoxin subunit NapH [candidate division LCP-89 bacterium B3_LCP]
MSRGYFYYHRFIISRRIVQLSILLLYILARHTDLDILKGDLTFSELLGVIPFADPYAVLQIIATGSIPGKSLIIGGLIILLFYALIGGRVFCSWVCPMNIVTDSASALRRKLKIDQDDKPTRISRKIRYWALGLSLILSLIFGLAAFESISPVSILHRGIIYGFGYGWLVVLAIFLIDLFVLKNGFCGNLCPLGAFYAFISKFSVVRIKHIKEKCNLCMDCRVICPEPHVLPMIGKHDALVLSGECNNCGRCIEVCKDDSMMFSLRTKSVNK